MVISVTLPFGMYCEHSPFPFYCDFHSHEAHLLVLFPLFCFLVTLACSSHYTTYTCCSSFKRGALGSELQCLFWNEWNTFQKWLKMFRNFLRHKPHDKKLEYITSSRITIHHLYNAMKRLKHGFLREYRKYEGLHYYQILVNQKQFRIIQTTQMVIMTTTSKIVIIIIIISVVFPIVCFKKALAWSRNFFRLRFIY